jgi:hypothetical protein
MTETVRRPTLHVSLKGKQPPSQQVADTATVARKSFESAAAQGDGLSPFGLPHDA